MPALRIYSLKMRNIIIMSAQYPRTVLATKSKRIKRFNAHLFTDRQRVVAAEMEDNEAVPDGGNRENKEDS